MKNSIKLLFQEKILKFCEGANLLICFLKKIPKIRNKFTNEWFGLEKAKVRSRIGILALIGAFIMEFLKKFVYALVFVYIPYKLIGKLCINVLNNQEKSIIYFFIIMTTLCGSIINSTVFMMSDRDYIMLRVIQVKSKMHYFGRILYKMISELVYFTIILLILGVSIKYSIIVSFLTIAMRPLGECISLIIYDHVAKIHAKRSSINGVLMAAAFIIAYVFPYVDRSISDLWYKISNLYFLIAIFIIALGAMVYLWTYKKYEKIAQDAVYIRRENKL